MQIKETNLYHSLIIDTIKEMIGLAKKGNFTAKQELNGVTVLVNGDSNADLIFRDQQRAQSGYIEGEVGPNPKAKLTAEDNANDARVEAENERKRQKRQAEYDKKARAHREKVEAKLVNAPAIELADEAGWQKSKEVNSDGYGGAVMTYSERWARLMQVEMSNGKKLADVADATSQEADLEGITGFMYGCAVSQLASCWKHGDELRRWHNIKTQLGNEGEKANESGGVLNPALLSVSPM
jgi:hypothetical protein